jgi:hypothetical protein
MAEETLAEIGRIIAELEAEEKGLEWVIAQTAWAD